MEQYFLPYGRHHISENDVQAVKEVLQSDFLTTGPVVDRFEQALAGRVGARYCVVFNSGTAALHAAYYAAGVGEADEVITSPITFAATANAALYLGAVPAFADITENSFNIDPVEIEKAVTPRTKVIAPVDMAGIPAPLDAIMEIARGKGIAVVEDACHALGAVYRGRRVGSIVDMTVFSFHPVKHVTTGEGGAVSTDNPDYYEKLKVFRNHGVVRDSSLFEVTSDEVIGPWYYEQQELGYNYRLPDLNCALGLSQLSRLDAFLERRRSIVGQYNQAFAENTSLMLPPVPENGSTHNHSPGYSGPECSSDQGKTTLPAWHLYILRLAGSNPLRRKVFEELRQNGIGVQVHYLPVYFHPYYRKLGYKPGLCPRAEDYYQRAFSIPLFPAMADEDVQRVVESVEAAVANAGSD